MIVSEVTYRGFPSFRLRVDESTKEPDDISFTFFVLIKILPVADDDPDDEEGDVDNRDEVTHAECGPVVDHLHMLRLFLPAMPALQSTPDP